MLDTWDLTCRFDERRLMSAPGPVWVPDHENHTRALFVKQITNGCLCLRVPLVKLAAKGQQKTFRGCPEFQRQCYGHMEVSL